MLIFVGVEMYQLDDRNRIPIPPNYRAAFEEGGYINRGQAPCLQLFTPEAFEKEAEKYDAIPTETEEGDDARREFFGSARNIQKDSQGRITLRDEFIEYAGITKDVAVVGVRDKLEIWDRDTYIARVPAAAANRAKATARRLKGGE